MLGRITLWFALRQLPGRLGGPVCEYLQYSVVGYEILYYSSHVERLESDWVVNGRSVLDQQNEEGDGQSDGAAYFAQRRISLSNFKRYQQPSSHHDEGIHLYERTVKSGIAFRAHLVQEGRLTVSEDRELASLERNMEACHPIIDGVIFLG